MRTAQRAVRAAASAPVTPRQRKGEATRPPLLPKGDGTASGAGETREKLLVATHELLYERVGGAVSVHDLCARAGVNVAMVKYCFGGKDGLMAALSDRLMRGFVPQLDKLDRRDLRAEEKLRIHIGEVIRNYLRYPYVNRLLTTQLLSADEDGLAMLINDFAIPTRDWYRRLLVEGQVSGAFRVVDPTLFFFTVLGTAEFFFTAQPLLRGFGVHETGPGLLDRYIAHVTDIVLHGVQSEARSRRSISLRSRSTTARKKIQR